MFGLPHDLVRHLMGIVPDTHEVGGVLHVNANGHIRDASVHAGEPCVAGGAHTGACSVPMIPRLDDRDVAFHTHPIANRPSSVDLRHAVEGDPSVSYVITKNSAWEMTPARQQDWRNLTSEARRRTVLLWRTAGGLLERRLQSGDPDTVADAVASFARCVEPYVRLRYIPSTVPSSNKK